MSFGESASTHDTHIAHDHAGTEIVSFSVSRCLRGSFLGGPATHSLSVVPRPTPAAREVRVRVHAAGVGPWDAWVRAGRSAIPWQMLHEQAQVRAGQTVLIHGAAGNVGAYAVQLAREAGSVDAVLDTVGGDVQTRSLQVLKPGGVLVSSVSPPNTEEARQRNVRALFFLDAAAGSRG
jgi:NADPH:quinone reductase-like Zn-dependent oxidoreductase